MTVRVEIVDATEAHAEELAPRMRPADVAEVDASAGMLPGEALHDALEHSTVARAALFHGQVGCIWGIVPLRRSILSGRSAAVWMLTSELVERHQRAFWRGCRAELPKLFEHADVLVNAIDSRNDVALRWARRLGFKVGEPVPFGARGVPFCWFTVQLEDLPHV